MKIRGTGWRPAVLDTDAIDARHRFEWDGDLESQGFHCEETHISKVYLGPHDAWKIKKPVAFGFLDYSTPEKRKAACEAEVELNRRFAPAIYLGVEPLLRRPTGHYVFGGYGMPLEWAVHMVRLPESDRADRRLREGRLWPGALRALAGRLAAFHSASPADADGAQFAAPAAIARNLEESFIQSRPFLPTLLGKDARELEDRMRARLWACAPGLEARYHGNRICDGHGDLRLCQVYFDDSGRSEILDCIEFNDRFRFGDPAADIAFLSMDLAFHGRPDLAEGFLAAYAEVSGDFDLYSVVDYYQAYRACVRGEVEGLRAGEMEPGPERTRKDDEARAYYRFALAERIRPTPAVIAIGGGMGTGKTTLAGLLGERIHAPVVSTDPLRKRMAGIRTTEKRPDHLWRGLYDPAMTETVYAEAGRLAQLIGDSGRSVIVDASFRSRETRRSLRDAAVRAGRPFLFVECRAETNVCRDRLKQRDAAPNASDGNERNFEAFLETWEPVDDIPSAQLRVLDTTAPLEECVAQVILSLPPGGQ